MSGLTGFERKLRKRKEENNSFYRSAAMSIKPRLRKKLTAKTSWYKERNEDRGSLGGSGGEEKSRDMMCKGGNVGKGRRRKKNVDKKPGKSKIKAVMFVPYTHGSKLAKQLRASQDTE